MARISRRLFAIVILAALGIATSGCAIFDKTGLVLPKDGAESISSIEVDIKPFVFFVDDTVKPGNTVPCLKGRLYLVGDDSSARTIVGRGEIVVELFDTKAKTPDGQAKPVSGWHFEQAALKKMQGRDHIGLGYTLFLPFVEYTPSIKNVVLRVTYIDEKGKIYQQVPQPMTLRVFEEQPQVQISQFKNVPALQR